jgi:predicted secreted hydrolase
MSRAAAGLAGAGSEPLHIWLGSWSITGRGDTAWPLRLQADTPEMAIDLLLDVGGKPVVLQGEDGLSRKGAAPGNASYYYSYTRLPTAGTIRLGGDDFVVEGNSWFDREWSSSALAADQQGWDWFALQLDDGRDLMFYRLRGRHGEAQPFSRGVLVAADGSVEQLSLDNTVVEPLRTWTSTAGIVYPLEWRLQVAAHGIDVRVAAAFNDQEMRHTVHYWEGAVRLSGSHGGRGYLELSGYAVE